jgi:hypothetical protein
MARERSCPDGGCHCNWADAAAIRRAKSDHHSESKSARTAGATAPASTARPVTAIASGDETDSAAASATCGNDANFTTGTACGKAEPATAATATASGDGTCSAAASTACGEADSPSAATCGEAEAAATTCGEAECPSVAIYGEAEAPATTCGEAKSSIAKLSAEHAAGERQVCSLTCENWPSGRGSRKRLVVTERDTDGRVALDDPSPQ